MSYVRYYTPPARTTSHPRLRRSLSPEAKRREELQLALVATLGALETSPAQAKELLVYMNGWLRELDEALPPTCAPAPKSVASQLFRELERTVVGRALESPPRSRAANVTRALERLESLRDSILAVAPGSLP